MTNDKLKDLVGKYDAGYFDNSAYPLEDFLIMARTMLAEPEKPAPQRQDSLTDQINTVRKLAVEHGCYDVEDWIIEMSDKTFSKPTAPASLVKKIEDAISNLYMFFPGQTRPWINVDVMSEILSDYEAAEDGLREELESIVSHDSGKTKNDWDSGYKTCVTEIKQILARHKGGR